MLGIKLDNGETVRALESKWVAAIIQELGEHDKPMLERICQRVKTLTAHPSLIIPAPGAPQFERRDSFHDFKVDVK